MLVSTAELYPSVSRGLKECGSWPDASVEQVFQERKVRKRCRGRSMPGVLEEWQEVWQRGGVRDNEAGHLTLWAKGVYSE